MNKHYVYKWKRISGQWYIGVHNGTLGNYTGSGKKFRDVFDNTPREEWTREFLYENMTEDDAYAKESELVTLEIIEKDEMCLNLVPGGKSPATRWAQTSDGAKKLKEHGKWLGETFGKEMFTTEHQKKAAKAMAQKYADGFESRLKGRVYEDEEHKRLYPKATCPECGLTGNARQIKQWHGLDGKKCKAKREGN